MFATFVNSSFISSNSSTSTSNSYMIEEDVDATLFLVDEESHEEGMIAQVNVDEKY